ncbi:hypothetical protein [Microcoleus sp. FACHB-68]|uniref:hypothetical protein n=1 Tax=Microcoleus sp. FACHB-68 TaxID=2692826 RepID=UPI0016897116|nr:hypothetical protein [Microcoleus sp. FACHB-68]MBD1940736.1 hypothetical protein [Microcoleus sp. FACHB-68]
MPNRIMTDEMRDDKTPDEVIVRAQPRQPVTDPTLGISVSVDREGTPQHRLVTIGDSLTHGFQSGSIFNTNLSYPAIIAWEMDWDEKFRHPLPYSGWGGLPFNIEALIRRLEQQFGDKLDWWELAGAVFSVHQYMADVEEWWERGPGSRIPNQKGINHNLAVYGWDLRDTLSRNADICRQLLEEPKDNLFRQIVENANERAALYVLDSARDTQGKALTPLEAAAELGKDGTHETGTGDGIETLIIFLGANNALGSVIQLKVAWSQDGYDDLDRKQQFTVWNPIHFKKELDEVVAQVKKMKARHVILATVPHVTIIPLARGVGEKVAPGSRYFPHYTRPWISDRDFNPKDHPCITELEARAVDSAIDQYNEAITEAVRGARKDGLDWYLFDVAGIMDRLAYRRYIDDPLARPEWWTPYELPAELQALSPVPNSRFFTSEMVAGEAVRTNGGLFSLDGIHPTTIGYGILAQEFINIMQQAGVKFYLGDGRTQRNGPVRVDFNRLIALDTLISDPPRSLSNQLDLIAWLDQRLKIFSRLLRRGA